MSIRNQEVNLITNLLKDIQYGSITIIVNEGKIVQVDSLKKKRFNSQNGRSNRNYYFK
ncbi:YezD family protein [Niallia oryzisoli]|uniref:YezD family protein n=1 Tax=Niallia oryzisoli TaxID=1737571 RepID=A0ABZ2CKM1_9BACI